MVIDHSVTLAMVAKNAVNQGEFSNPYLLVLQLQVIPIYRLKLRSPSKCLHKHGWTPEQYKGTNLIV